MLLGELPGSARPGLVMLPGIHAWIEAKAHNGALRPHQVREHARLQNAGCQVYVVCGEDQAESLVSHLAALSRSVEP